MNSAAPDFASDAEQQIRATRTAYERIAPLYDLVDAIYEWSWKRKLRARLFAFARGHLLDVGVGTGCNMPFYPAGAKAIGIDASPKMLRAARQRADRLGVKVDLKEMNLLSLGFRDGTFDTVSATFVLLCLPDELQERALRELSRVLRPHGRILLLDYQQARSLPVRWWTRVLSGWLRWAFAGRFDAATTRFISKAGLEVEHRQTFMGGGVAMLVLRRAAASVPPG